MNCQDAEILLNKRLDGRLTATESHRLDEHLSLCEICTAAASEFDGLRAAFQADRGVTPHVDGLADRVMDQILRAPPGAPRISAVRRSWWRPLSAAAAILLLAGSAFFLGRETAEARSDQVSPELEVWVQGFIAQGADRSAVEEVHGVYLRALRGIDEKASLERDAAYRTLSAALEGLVQTGQQDVRPR